MTTFNPARLPALRILRCWFDAYTDLGDGMAAGDEQRIDWLRTLPFVALHAAVPAVFLVGWSTTAVLAAIMLYAVRMFAITGFYHRYFSHKAFQTSRLVQFLFAAIGASAAQRGPLWWAAHHRVHHLTSDQKQDEHSPRQRGFLWSQMGWFLSRRNFPTQLDRIQDFAAYPELRFLDRYCMLMPVLLAVALFTAGEALERYQPGLGTDGWQLLVWGFVVSTVVLYHVTFTINSIAHTAGTRRFDTPDDSRNSPVLALLTFGEGWHNNHHYYPVSARQGFTWWEIDITYYLLRILQGLGLIRHLRPVPPHILARRSRFPLTPRAQGRP